jgi:WD40 repeat protein
MASSSIISRHSFKSECYSLSFSKDTATPYFASSFADKSVKVWNLNDILVHSKGLEDVACTVPNATEIGPVDTQVCGNRLGVTSVDGSLKVFDLSSNAEGAIESKLVVDSNVMERPAAAEGDASSFELDPWKFCFNPSDNSQLVTG